MGLRHHVYAEVWVFLWNTFILPKSRVALKCKSDHITSPFKAVKMTPQFPLVVHTQNRKQGLEETFVYHGHSSIILSS